MTTFTDTLTARIATTKAGMPALALALSMAAAAPTTANSVVDRQTGSLRPAQVNDAKIGLGNGSVIVAPIPFSNPMIGTGLTLGAAYLFKTDEGSDPSGVGVAALRSDNDSQAAVIGANLNLDNNRWKLSAMVGEADLRYDLYASDDLQIPLRQDGNLGRFTLGYGVAPDVTIGGIARYLDSTITANSSITDVLPPELQPALNAAIVNVGLEAFWDTRDDTIYPTEGLHLKVSSQQGFIVDGLGEDYHKTFALRETTVLATRAAMCGATDGAPFFDACGLGGFDGFRGYNATQILSTRSMSVQAELRQRLGARFGGVAFLGFGGAGTGFSDLDQKGSAAGIGLRYRVSKKFPVDFAVDGSYNADDEALLYISVGQRF